MLLSASHILEAALVKHCYVNLSTDNMRTVAVWKYWWRYLPMTVSGAAGASGFMASSVGAGAEVLGGGGGGCKAACAWPFTALLTGCAGAGADTGTRGAEEAAGVAPASSAPHPWAHQSFAAAELATPGIVLLQGHQHYR